MPPRLVAKKVVNALLREALPARRREKIAKNPPQRDPGFGDASCACQGWLRAARDNQR